jgi:hypothetical protein
MQPAALNPNARNFPEDLMMDPVQLASCLKSME